MNVPLPSTESNTKLERAKTAVGSIATIVTSIMKDVDGWLQAKHPDSDHDSVVLSVHAHKIIDHAAGLAERIAGLDTPSNDRVLLLSDGCRIRDDVLGTNKVVETSDAYTENKLNDLDQGDIRDAIEFDTELKDMFGLAWIDDEARTPLRDALHLVHDEMERGATNVAAVAVKALKDLLKRHPRGFARYYTGTDPWPRPSAEIQAEIDAQMPDALRWLRYELKEAREKEGVSPKSANDSPDDELISPSGPSSRSPEGTQTTVTSDADMPFPIRLLRGSDIDESLFDDRGRRVDLDESFFSMKRSTPGYLPIEADENLRKHIEADLTVSPHHLETLEDLKRQLASDAEKERVFCGSLDATAKEVLNLLLEVSIREIETECATVVGVVNTLILAALDIRVAEQRNTLAKLIL